MKWIFNEPYIACYKHWSRSFKAHAEKKWAHPNKFRPPQCVSNWNCSHNWLTHTKHIHTCTKWIRSRSLLLKSATYHLSLTRSLQWTGGLYEGGEIMSALLEGENNGSELEPLISEPNKTFVVIFLIFSVLFSLIFLSKTRIITENCQKWPQILVIESFLHTAMPRSKDWQD